MRYPILMAVGLLLSGCSSTYKQEVIAPASEQLDRARPVAIATPINGVFGNREYETSGAATAQAVRAAFARHVTNATISVSCHDATCLKAEGRADGYHVVPVILQWEDRATEWSGKRDKIEVKLSVFDAETGREIASTIISGKSKSASWGGDRPDELLAKPIQEYVASLF